MSESGNLEEELRFCQVVYFPTVRSENWMELFSKFALRYATVLGREITHFNLWPKDNTVRSSMLRYIKRNQGRLIKAIESRMYKGISFYSKGEGAVWSSFCLSLLTEDILSLRDIGMGQGDEIIYGTLLLEYKLDFLKNHTDQISVSKEFLDDTKSIVNTRYGAITVMPWKKIPESYFRNSTSHYLSDEEKQEVKVWAREGHRFETIVRDIYWGNVLTRKHWGNDKSKEEHLLKALQKECKDNVLWIDDDTLFFCAPFDICPQDAPKMIDFKECIYKVFDELEIEIIRAHLDRYPEPEVELLNNLIQEDAGRKSKKLRSKKKLIIRYRIRKDSEETKEQKCIEEVLKQAGHLPLIIKPEKVPDGLLCEIEVNGSKVPKVRQAIIYCVKKLNMDIEISPPMDEEDQISETFLLII